MDRVLCDELVEEIFHRLPPRSSAALSLVSKRWLRLLRSSTTFLSLRLDPPRHVAAVHSLSSFLSHYPFLTSLSLVSISGGGGGDGGGGGGGGGRGRGQGDSSCSYDHLLISVISCCPNLRHLRFLLGPVSLCSLFSLQASFPHLSSLTITLSRPLSFHWLILFPSLKDLSISFAGSSEEVDLLEFDSVRKFDAELEIESLFLSGIRAGDHGLNWLWGGCRKLKRLKLKSCEGIGDDLSLDSFVKCLKNLIEVELRKCRTIVDGVLAKLAENCPHLNSLLVYDGGSKQGLLQFLTSGRSNIQNLDLRLPLDLDNNHLFAISENFTGLSSLRLHSCCLVTGDGLKSLGSALSNVLEELALINCDVVEREPGLLTTLGQNLKKLRILDLSDNEMLADKEFKAMIISCNCLSELKLRGCSSLTNDSMVSIYKYCKQLQNIDIMYCLGIEISAVEWLVLNSPYLKRVQIEQSKLSGAVKKGALDKFIDEAA